MVIRFKGMPFKEASLRAVVARLISETPTYEENGVLYSPFTIKNHFYVMPGGDLYIDDDYDEELTGMMLQGIYAKGYDRDTIVVPRMYKHLPDAEIPVIREDTPEDAPEDAPEDTDILNFEDFLPDEAFDDGHFEEEMRDILNMDPDDE